MFKTWPSWRTWRRIGLGVGAALILILLALRLLAMSPVAHNLVEARIEALSIRGQSIEIDGLSGDLLGRLSVETLTVRDQDGIWLTASQLDLGWHPVALLSRHLKISEVSAETLDLSRRPVLAPSAPSSGSVADRYTLDLLRLERIALAEGVAGPAQSYSAKGALSADGARGGVQFELTTLGPDGDQVRADLTWGGAVPLAGEMQVSAVPNGLLATLLGAPPDTTMRFDLTSAPGDDTWQLLASGEVGGEPSLNLDIQLAANRYAAAGEVALDQLAILAPLQRRLGQKLTFEGSVESDTQLRATLGADTLTSTISGTVQSSQDGIIIENMDLSVQLLDARQITALQSLSLPQFSANGTLYLLRDQRAFEGQLNAEDFAYGRYQFQDVQSDGRLNLAPGLLNYDGQLQAAQVSGLPTPVQAVLAGPQALRLDAAYHFQPRDLRARLFRLEGRTLDAMGQGAIAINGPVDLSADIQLTGLAPLAQIDAQLALRGPGLADLEITADGNTAMSATSGTIGTVIGDQANFAFTARRTASGYNLRSSRIQNERLEATATGALENGALDLKGRFDMTSLVANAVSASGLAAEFEISGPLTAPRLNTTARADWLTLAGQRFVAPKVSANVTFNESQAFTVAAQSNFSGEALSLNLLGHRSGGIVDLTQVHAAWAALQATGRATLDPNAPRDASLEFEIAGTTPIGGAVNGSLSYEAERLNTDLSLTDLSLGVLELEQTQLTLAGAWPDFTGALDYQAEFPLLGTPQDLRGNHAVRLDADNQILALSGTSNLAGNDILITNPLRVSLNPNLRLAGGVSAFGGDVSMIFDATGATPAVLALSGIKMSEIGPLLDRPSLVGTLDGAFTLGFEGGTLTGGGAASLINLARGLVEADDTNLILDARIDADTLVANLRTDEADQGLDLLANLSVPLSHQNTLGSVRIAPGAAIPVSIKGRGGIAPIWALIAPTNLRFAGDVDLDISNGDGSTWRFEGPVMLENGVFEDGFTGIHLEQISADAQLRPDGIDVNQVSARGAGGGQVTGRGLYGFDGNGSVTMTLNRLNALRRSDVSGSISGTAEIERRNRRTQINGDLEIDQARVNLERLPGAGYTTLEVDFLENGERDEATTPTREAIELRLDVSADRRIFVSGSGIDTEWGLDARVTGPPGRPNVIGRATLIRGEADLLSRRFRFSEGAVRFVGEPIDSQISIRADRVSDDITSSISLTGTITAPEITLSSDPALPDDEILSRVLFGRSPSELSPLQAAQLAGAAAQLAGGDAFNLVGQLQEATGLDRLDIGLDEAGGATLATGKYLADDIYLEIESGVTGAPGVTLEWTPLENVAVDAELDPELGPKLAIQWKRDFDRLPGEPKND